MRIIPEETYGIIENLLAAMIFFSPNFLLLFDFWQKFLFGFLLYNYIIIFLIISAMSHFRFSRHYQKPDIEEDINILKKL